MVRRYDSAGAALGGAATVRSSTSDTQGLRGIDLTMDADGDFAVASHIDH